MDEAAMCDRIALIQSGSILGIDTPEKIRQSYPRKLYAVKSNAMYTMLKDIRADEQVHDCFIFGENLHLSFKSESAENEPKLLEYLVTKGYTGVKLEPVEPTVEDSFIDKTLSR
jgi:ABC-type multidrug transport system ATPase subunit